MNNRLISFGLAVTHLLSFFIIGYAMKLASHYDPDIRGVEMIIICIVWLANLIAMFVHMWDVLFPRIQPQTKEY